LGEGFVPKRRIPAIPVWDKEREGAENFAVL